MCNQKPQRVTLTWWIMESTVWCDGEKVKQKTRILPDLNKMWINLTNTNQEEKQGDQSSHNVI